MEVVLTGNRARLLQGLATLAAGGKYASYLDLIDHVWQGDHQHRSFDILRANLGTNIHFLRLAGLRECILNKRGVGYYWSPGTPPTIDTSPGKRTPFPTGKRRTLWRERQEKTALNTAIRKLSSSLEGRLPRVMKCSLVPALIEAGFRDADIARLFGVSRAAAGVWRKELEET